MRLIFCKFVTFLIYLHFTSTQSVATEQASSSVKIAINAIPGLLEENNDALAYNKILAALNQKTGFPVVFHFSSAIRASVYFNQKETDCLFPSSLVSNIFEQEAMLESEPINIAKAYFIGHEVLDAKQMITDKNQKYVIGFIRGNSFGSTIEQLQHHTLIPLSSDTQAVKLLRRGRINAVLAYLPDSLSILQTENNLPLKYAENSLFYSQKDNIICHQNPQNREFLNDINKHIIAMKESGELRGLLGEAFIE